MTVSVLMTTYNQANYVERAMCSVLEQTYEDFELLYVDDGSTDGTLDVLRHISDHRIAGWVEQPTPEIRAQTVRYATLLNDLASRAWGDYLTFLCGDDAYLPTRLERMVAKIEEGGSVVYGPQLMVDEAGREMGVRPAGRVLKDAYHRVDLNSVMVTRKAFDAVGGFPDWPATPQLWREADAQFWRKLTDAGYWFVPVDGAEPTDVKRYLDSGVDARVIAGLEPW